MDAQQLINEVQKLPLDSQKQVLYSLTRSLGQQPESQPSVSEDEVGRLPLAKGVISEIPCGLDDAESREKEFITSLLAKGIISEIPPGLYEEEEDFEPVEIEGEPISETIIRERR